MIAGPDKRPAFNKTETHGKSLLLEVCEGVRVNEFNDREVFLGRLKVLS
jgi:hypothetical protein